MILRVPHYYEDFTCIASECKDNCCIGGWEIEIDEETVQSYWALSGPFGDRLREAIDQKDGYCFKLNNGRCPFLDSHNLCEIYQTLGPQQMGVVCTQFPRFTEYFGNIKETGIGLACEEAERVIFSEHNPFSLVCRDSAEIPITDGEYDQRLGNALFTLRDGLFTVIGLPGYDIFEKLAGFIALGHRLQHFINTNDYTAIESICAHFKPEYIFKDYMNYSENEGNACTDLQTLTVEQQTARIINAYQELEILSDDWTETIEHVLDTLHTESASDTANAGIKYNEVCKAYADSTKMHAYEYDNLIQYYLFRYLMKAAYDHDLYGKIQFICANFLVIHDMDMTRWLDNDRKFTFDDRIETVHIFSREVEYSEDNLWVLTEEFIFDDLLKPEPLSALMRQLHALNL